MATTDGWNYADVWEAVADRFPTVLALAHGEHERTWRAFDERADGVAAGLLAAGRRARTRSPSICATDRNIPRIAPSTATAACSARNARRNRQDAPMRRPTPTATSAPFWQAVAAARCQSRCENCATCHPHPRPGVATRDARRP